MVTNKNYTMISLYPDTKDRLRDARGHGKTYDRLINELLDERDRKNEGED